jgi:hypothetical protein
MPAIIILILLYLLYGTLAYDECKDKQLINPNWTFLDSTDVKDSVKVKK